MTTQRNKLGVAALSACALLALSACNPAAAPAPAPANPGTAAPGGAAPAGTSGGTFSKTLTGELKTSGYNPSDEVGKSRSDLATKSVEPAKVTMDTTNFDPQKFAAQAASGAVPDLIQVNRNIVGTLADKALIIPMDDCFALYDVKPSEYYYAAAIQDVTYNGKVYGAPQFFQAAMLIGNKKVMDPAGVKIEQFDTSKPDDIVELAKKIYKADGGKPTAVGFDADLPGSAAIWLAVFGGAPQDDKGKPTLDDPKNVAALTWMKKLMDAQGGFASIKSFKDTMDVFGNENQYVKNQVGVQTWAQWFINVLSNTKDKVSVAATPLKTADGKILGMAGGTALAIPKAAKNPSAACAWAVKVTSLDAWKAAGDARAQTVKTKNSINTGLFTGSPVADKAVRDAHVVPSGNADFDQLIKTSYDALGNTFSFGGSAAGQSINDALNNAVAVTLSGEKQPDAALKDAQDTAMRAWQQTAVGKNG